MRENKKNITSLHDVRPPETFKQRQPKITVSSVVPSSFDYIDEAKTIDVKIKGTPIEEIKIRPQDPTFILSNLKRQSSKSDAQLINKRKVRNKFHTLIFSCIVLFIVLYGLSLYNLKSETLLNFSSAQDELKNAIIQFRNFENSEAGSSFQNASDNLKIISEKLNQRGILKISSMLGAFFPVAKNAKQSFDTFKIALDGAMGLNDNISNLKNSGLSHFMNGRGDKITEILKSMQLNLSQVVSSGETLQKLSASLSGSALFNELNLPDPKTSSIGIGEGHNAKEFINSLISIFTNKEPVHLLLLFQNSSEIRPSGGFIGSYADLTIKDGALNAIDVRDIYDPDGWVKKKVIPPKQLQSITPSWEARDANWFFDYKTSAEKVIGLLEDSLFYKEKQISFIGAVAINTNVMEELLGITGSIELPSYGLTITQENFLEKIQQEVEAGQNKLKNQPKKILSDLTPKILENLSGLGSEGKEKLFGILKDNLMSKNMQIYFKDKSMEQFMIEYNVGGTVFEEQGDINSDYLAVINANIASGKTDAFIEQKITMKSSIDISGKATNSVTILREHKGGNSKYYWYNAINKNYLRLLTPKGTSLVDIKGETVRSVKPLTAYTAGQFVVDPEISKLENLNIESGKNVFSAWRYTNPKTSSTITFNYERPEVIKLSKDETYQIVFDKQSGVNSSINFVIEAPPGFRWKESKNSIFNYEEEFPSSRTIINLTLEEI